MFERTIIDALRTCTHRQGPFSLFFSVSVLLFILSVVSQSSAGETPQPVFVHSGCEGKASAEVLFSLKENVKNSRAYQLVRTLDDNGRMGIVLTVYMDCAERNDIVGIATSYGVAKCYGEKNCHLSVDGRSIKSTLCAARDASECGKSLFNAFDNYVKTSSRTVFKLN